MRNISDHIVFNHSYKDNTLFILTEYAICEKETKEFLPEMLLTAMTDIFV